jgi:hypothetical protein
MPHLLNREINNMTIGCCTEPTVTFSRDDDQLVVGDHVQTNNAKVTTGVAIARGDLLIISAANVATKATAPDVWDAISVFTLDAAQATAHAAGSFETGIYTQGEFDVSMVSLAGVKLTPAQYDAARARGAKLNIELRKVGI